MSHRKMSRRDFLKLAGAGVAAAAASSLPFGLPGRAMAQGKYPAGKVTLWSWGTPQLQTDWMTDFVKAKYPNAGITAEAVGQKGPGDIQQLLMTDFAAGGTTLPDFAQSDAGNIIAMAKAGVLVDLTDWAATIKDKMPDGIFKLWTVKDKVYAFPWRPNTWMMYYNRDLFSKAGVDVSGIKTWDDWAQAGVKIKTATNGNSLLEYRNGGSYWHTAQQMVPQAGGRYVDDKNNVVIDTNPATLEVFAHLEKLYKDGLLYKSPDFDPAWYQAFRDGKIAGIHYGNWFDEFLKENLADMAGKWGLMPLPAFSNGNHKGPMDAVPFGLINKKDAPYTGLIKEMLEWQYLDPDRVVAYLQSMTDKKLPAFLPVLKSAYDSTIMKAVDPYYGSQSFQAAAAESTAGTPQVLDPTLDGRGEIATVIDTELAKVYTGDQDMAAALKKMHEGIDRALPDILDARGN